ncbi:hypothetical protein [Streptomyces sp. SAJ15]|uniref:hypothetical protein n=1 Tax=Streptomyces sp. SAJ15 TaxID=2011095 RepID=UPI001185E6D6|nr:hypothetical protein [Streptomyces sp. SAJ15]
MDEMQRFVLLETLRLAVPEHMDDLRGFTPEQRCEIAKACAAIVGSHGDALQFGGKHCAEAFNALARGLAAAALTAWGGVTFDGLHWCAIPGCADANADHPQPHPERAPRRSVPKPRTVVDLHLPEPDQAA